MEDITVESVVNRPGDILPYAYIHPELDGKLKWVCGDDRDGKIISVFSFEGDPNRKIDILDTIEDAKKIRQDLIDAGWIKFVPPEMTFKYPGENIERPLNRKQKRALKKKLQRMQRNNPFRGESRSGGASSNVVDDDSESDELDHEN